MVGKRENVGSWIDRVRAYERRFGSEKVDVKRPKRRSNNKSQRSSGKGLRYRKERRDEVFSHLREDQFACSWERLVILLDVEGVAVERSLIVRPLLFPPFAQLHLLFLPQLQFGFGIA